MRQRAPSPFVGEPPKMMSATPRRLNASGCAMREDVVSIGWVDPGAQTIEPERNDGWKRPTYDKG